MGKCPHPDKARFASRQRAFAAARSLNLRAYHCACGAWHLTSEKNPLPRKRT